MKHLKLPQLFFVSALLLCLSACGSDDDVDPNGNPDTGVDRIPNIVNGLVAKYSFDGNSKDSLGNITGEKIVCGVTATSNRFGETNKAYAFDGSGYIEIPDDSLLANENLGFTLSIWAKADTRSSQQSLFSKAFDYQSLITPATPNLSSEDFYWVVGGDDGD